MSGRTSSLYGQDAPFDERAQPIAEQRLAVNNAYVDIRAPRRRLVVARRASVARKYSGPAESAIDIHKYDLLFEEVGKTGKRVNKRTQTSTTTQTTLYANGSLCQIGDAGEPHWQTRKRVRYLGFAGTRAETNLLGQDDRMMLPSFNGGIIDVLNRSDKVVPARTFLKFTIPKDMNHVAHLKDATGIFRGENPDRITPYLSEYDPRNQVQTVEFIADSISGHYGGHDGTKLYKTAVMNHDLAKVNEYPVYAATQFGDALAVIAAAFAVADSVTATEPGAVYAALKSVIENDVETVQVNVKRLLQNAFKASTKGHKQGEGGLDRRYHAVLSAVFHLFLDNGIGTPFDKATPDLSAAGTSLGDLFRYFITKDNAPEKALHAIKSAASVETRDIVAISLTGAAPGRPMRVLILQ